MKRRIFFKRLYLYLLALILVPLVRLLLRLVGYKRLSQWLVRLSPEPHAAPGHEEWRLGRARMTGGLVGRAAHHPVIQGNCLQRSLVLWWLLRWQGIASQIRVGMGKREGSLTAHAWVELDGIVVNDRADIATEFATFSDAIAPEKVMKLL